MLLVTLALVPPGRGRRCGGGLRSAFLALSFTLRASSALYKVRCDTPSLMIATGSGRRGARLRARCACRAGNWS